MLDAPPTLAADYPSVAKKHLLGILVDTDLSFRPLLRELVGRGRSLFEELLRTAEAGGFSVPVAAAQVPSRVASAILYPAPLLAAVPEAESTLNSSQVEWGRKLLGCHAGPRLKFSIVVAQCGWPMRLGTCFIERALMARARLRTLPPRHPAALMLEAASCLHS